jgi:predicted nucleotidyltransferase
VGQLLETRRTETAARIDQLRHDLADAEGLCADSACVYATGSFARGEANRHSDLDLFIVGQGTPEKPALSRLTEILIKADLIEVTRAHHIPDFSGDGEYLTHYTIAELRDTLGTPEDDVKNTFTARLLLLLESAPLLGRATYQKVIGDVISAYWRDYQDHKGDFMPAFLANDVLRMWRTFCVNYEARTQSEPAERKAKRKLKNYKLKHSRLLTCYSALLYLLAVFVKNHTVSPNDATHMVSLSPTQRLEWLLAEVVFGDAHTKIRELLKRYEDFLENTDASEEDLVKRFLNKDQSTRYFKSAYVFGDLVFDVLDAIGKRNQFHRLLVV